MKVKTLLGCAGLLSLITACSIHESNGPLAPNLAMAAESNIPLEDLGKGYAIFVRHCMQCHEERIPNEIPTEEWHAIVPGMAWNAGLSKNEENLVTNYVIAASKVKPVTQLDQQ